jgi:hypothetical protein
MNSTVQALKTVIDSQFFCGVQKAKKNNFNYHKFVISEISDGIF